MFISPQMVTQLWIQGQIPGVQHSFLGYTIFLVWFIYDKEFNPVTEQNCYYMYFTSMLIYTVYVHIRHSVILDYYYM